jgi:uncharacterized protein
MKRGPGLPHWKCARENSLRLAKKTGADQSVTELFAFLHDSKRMNDDYDPEHGVRAAQFADKSAGIVFGIDENNLKYLINACRFHCDGIAAGHISVPTSWDADRLDLGRVGIKPEVNRLCTEAVRNPQVLNWAYNRSIG